MRKILFLTILLTAALGVTAQKSIDKLFEKYSDNEGFVTLTISGDILNILRCSEEGEKENCLPAKIDEIRILAQQEDSRIEENFYEKIMQEINRGDYEEFMKVKKYHQDMVMLVKSEGRHFREFLLVAGGDDDNVLIQIKGDMTFDEAKRFSAEMKKDCCTTHITGKVSL